MREMLTPTSMIAGMGLDKDVALLTDGRSLALHVVHLLVTYLQKLRLVAPSLLLKMGYHQHRYSKRQIGISCI